MGIDTDKALERLLRDTDEDLRQYLEQVKSGISTSDADTLARFTDLLLKANQIQISERRAFFEKLRDLQRELTDVRKRQDRPHACIQVANIESLRSDVEAVVKAVSSMTEVVNKSARVNAVQDTKLGVIQEDISEIKNGIGDRQKARWSDKLAIRGLAVGLFVTIAGVCYSAGQITGRFGVVERDIGTLQVTVRHIQTESIPRVTRDANEAKTASTNIAKEVDRLTMLAEPRTEEEHTKRGRHH